MAALVELGSETASGFQDTARVTEYVVDRLRQTRASGARDVVQGKTMVVLSTGAAFAVDHSHASPSPITGSGNVTFLTASEHFDCELEAMSPEHLAAHQHFWLGMAEESWKEGRIRIEFSATDRDRTTATRRPDAKSMVQPARPLLEVIDELMADVPQSVWDKVPTDLARNLDHYLYGAPKEDE